MKFLSTTMLTALAAASCSVTPAASELRSETSADSAMIKGLNEFSFELFAAVGRNEKLKGKNVFISPASVSTAFGMTYVGARNDTATELASVLHYPKAPEAIAPEFKSLMGSLLASKDADGYELKIANRIWGQQNFGWQQSFIDSNLEIFNSRLGEVNFKNVDEHAAIVNSVNDWAADNTNGRIKNVLTVDNISEDSRILLANAIYFLADWRIPFVNPGNNVDRKGEFKRIGQEPAVATYMLHDEPQRGLKYFENSDLQVLDLPYVSKNAGRSLALTVVLPRAADGITALESSLTSKSLVSLFQQMAVPANAAVQVRLPKWELSSETMDMTPIFKSDLGASLAFNPDTADFSGMTGSRDIALNLVLHKTFIKVDEKGTEAAAVTVIGGMRTTSVRPDLDSIIAFNAQHPFLYFIRDTASGAILFAGRMMDPSAAQ